MFDKISKIFGKGKNKKTYEDRTILIVDDTEVDRKIVQKALETLGCRVVTANDGDVGFEVALKEKPDLILSDCNMPTLSGVEMCKKLKGYKETEEIPFIFLTSEDSPRKVIDCFEMDAYSYMCKPINAKLLNNQVEEILEEHLSDKQ